MKLARRVSSIQPSPTLAITSKAKAMKAEGIDVVGFGAGEPDFDTPEHIKAVAKKALDEGYTKYTPVPGTPELKDAVIEKFRRDNGLEYKRESILWQLFLIFSGITHKLVVSSHRSALFWGHVLVGLSTVQD